MDHIELRKSWKEEENRSFQGWDFSSLKDRWEEEPLPWDYKDILKKYLKPVYKLLDTGTGGGEFLLTLGHPYGNTSVTESWEPNVKLCESRLAPLGICVRRVYEDDRLPFEDNTFDMVINRHESYNAKEVGRVLKPGGIFVTQQVGGRNDEFLSRRLIKDFIPKFSYWNLGYASEELKNNSFEIIYGNECFPLLRFYDVGAIVYFARIIEWEFPDFSVDSCFKELCGLQQELEEKTFIECYEHRFLIASKNSK